MHLPTPSLKIAVLDRGFVYVGLCHTEDGALVVEQAHNIRRWGASAGLGELAMCGPQSATKLDRTTTIRAPMNAVIHLIDADAAAWADTLAKAA